MAILEKEVEIGLGSFNTKHFENLGYEIPKRIDKYGNLRYIKGQKITVKVEDLTDGSNVRVTKICDTIECGKHVPNQSYSNVLKKRKNSDGSDRCKTCANKKSGDTKRNNVKYENSLEFWAKENDKQYLLLEYSSKNKKLPSRVSRATNDKYWWNCPDCYSEYDVSVNSRTIKSTNCPYCSNRRVNHTNCLWTTHPEVARLLTYEEVGYKITYGTPRKESFTCSDCNHIDNKTVGSIVAQGFSCSRCSDGMKYPEKFMLSVLSQLEVEFETQKTFDWSKNVSKLNGNKIYDFYTDGMIIETHGGQHYFDNTFENLGGKTLSETKENDEIKKSLALNSGEITRYIVINCSESNMDFIKSNILKSELAEIFDLSKIDWKLCNEFATSNIVKVICDYWNNGIKNTLEISKSTKISRTTVIEYLKKASLLEWCDYNPEEEMKKNGKNNRGKGTKKIVQLSIEGDFIKEWESVTKAEKELNISRSKISNVCTGKRNKTGGFRWMFKDEYMKLKGSLTPITININKRSVVQLDKNGVFIDEWESIAEAGRGLNISSGHISDVCNEKRKTASGFKWMYKKDYDVLNGKI